MEQDRRRDMMLVHALAHYIHDGGPWEGKTRSSRSDEAVLDSDRGRTGFSGSTGPSDILPPDEYSCPTSRREDWIGAEFHPELRILTESAMRQAGAQALLGTAYGYRSGPGPSSTKRPR